MTSHGGTRRLARSIVAEYGNAAYTVKRLQFDCGSLLKPSVTRFCKIMPQSATHRDRVFVALISRLRVPSGTLDLYFSTRGGFKPRLQTFDLVISCGNAVAVRVVETFSNPISNGLHDFLLVSATVANVIWNKVPFLNHSRHHLFGRSKNNPEKAYVH